MSAGAALTTLDWAEMLDLTVDPGPLARLETLKLDANAPSVIFARLTAEEPETLKEIAKAWGLPRGKFIEWFTTEHAGLYDTALKVLANDLAHEALAVADEQNEVVKKDGTRFDPDVPRDKLRVDTRLRLASHWDRARYGAAKESNSGGVTVIVDRSCGGSVAVEAPGGAKVTVGNVGTEASLAHEEI